MSKVKYGLKNVHYALETDNGYATPVAINGAVNLSLDASGDTAEFYADDILYFTSASNNGYEGDLEIALIPDSFYTDILGFTIDTNGAIIEKSDAIAKNFALGFEVSGDVKGRKTWLYKCVATRPSSEASTNAGSLEPKTDTISLKAIPRDSDRKVKVVMEESTDNTAAFAGFFDEVYEGVIQSA